MAVSAPRRHAHLQAMLPGRTSESKQDVRACRVENAILLFELLDPFVRRTIGNLNDPRLPRAIGPDSPMTLLSESKMLPGLK
eukprot:2614763-Prymnesium_polylepis.1